MLHARKDYQERIQDSAGLIPDDEPVFLLRAQDVLFEQTLGRYCDLIEDRIASGLCDEATVAKLKRVLETVKQHDRLADWWRIKNVDRVKLPDLPPEA